MRPPKSVPRLRCFHIHDTLSIVITYHSPLHHDKVVFEEGIQVPAMPIPTVNWQTSGLCTFATDILRRAVLIWHTSFTDNRLIHQRGTALKGCQRLVACLPTTKSRWHWCSEHESFLSSSTFVSCFGCPSNSHFSPRMTIFLLSDLPINMLMHPSKGAHMHSLTPKEEGACCEVWQVRTFCSVCLSVTRTLLGNGYNFWHQLHTCSKRRCSFLFSECTCDRFDICCKLQESKNTNLKWDRAHWQ